MVARKIEYLVQPGEERREDNIGMRLAGVEDDVGEDRHNLLILIRLLEEGVRQSFHLRPEANASHRKLPLEALAEISIQTIVLRFIQLEFLRDMQWVSGGLTSGQGGTDGLQPQ